MTRFFYPLAVLLVLVLQGDLQAASNRLNFIFILVDDWGYTDAACYGSDLLETPAIDRLAREGVRFSNAYSACTVCSPTRAAVLTGQYPARLHVTDFIPGHPFVNTPLLIPDWTQRLEHRHVTIAEELQQAGYKTAHVGKWHLTPRDRGDETKTYPDYWPTRHGFDVNIGGARHGAPGSYFWPYGRGKNRDINRVINLPDGGRPGEYLTDRLTDETIQIIENWKDDPFFLYLPHYAVHTPIEGKPELVAYYKKNIRQGMRHRNAVYAAMVHSVDQSVGRIMQTLRRLKIADRTVVFLTSDNGGLIGTGAGSAITSNLPIRNGKGSVYEGGVRVPAIVKWPGVTPEAAVCDEPIISVDYFPTILEMAGIDRVANEVDGRSIVALLKKPASTLQREAIFWHYPHYHSMGGVPYGAIRAGDWKLIEFYRDGRLELYHLAKDVHEDRNLAKQNPAIAKRLHIQLDDWRTRVGAQMPRSNPHYDASQPTGVLRNGTIRPAAPVRRED